MALALLILGAVLIIVGTAALSIPAAVIVAGGLTAAAGADLARRTPPT